MRRIYEWEKWFGQRRTVLLRGIHYRCSQSAMVQMIRSNASARNMRVRVIDTMTELVIEVIGTRSNSAVPNTDTSAITR